MPLAKCGNCRFLFEEISDCQSLSPCPNCGSKTRIFDESITLSAEAHLSQRFKHKRQGHKGPIATGFSGDDFWRDGRTWVQKEMLVDKLGNHYLKKIVDPRSGAVIHYCDEPLDQHIGHGSAKKRRN